MKSKRQAILLAMALVGAWAGRGWSLEEPELVSQSGGTAGTALSGGNRYDEPVRSPVLDDGTVFFLSGTEFGTYDSNGVVDLYVSEAGVVSAVSLAAVGADSGNAEAVRVSADGQTVALLRELSGLSEYPRVVILDRSGTSVVQTTLDDDPDVTDIALSTDGAYLAFVTPADGLNPLDSNGRNDLFYCPVAETAQFTYVPTVAEPSRPSISADGSVIVFLAGGSLYVRTDGTTTAIAAAGSAVSAATVAGDGDWIAFVSAANLAGDTDGLADVFRIRRDGTGLEQVSITPMGADFAVAADSRDAPAISADGRYVAFTAPVPGGSVLQLWVRDTALGRTECASVVSGSVADADCRAPAMAPAGRYLTFGSAATNLVAGTGGIGQVYRVALPDGWGSSGGDAPVQGMVDDRANIIAWEWVAGHESASEYEISLDGGITWTTADANPYCVGNVAADPGLVLIRLRATSTSGSGASLVLASGLTATAEDDLPLWSVAIACPSLGTDAAFGMATAAQTVAGALPDETAGGICLLDAAESPLAGDWRADAAEADWLFVARSAADAETVWAWTLPDEFPEGFYLSLWEIDDAGEPVGATALDLDQTRTFTLAAGEERRFQVRFAVDRTVDFALAKGWNQVSLPVVPASSVIEEIFVDGEGTALVRAEGLRLIDGASYESITETAIALDPFWVYAPAATSLLVRGTPATLDEWTLVAGWNLVCVPAPVALSSLTLEGDKLASGFLEWDAAGLRYQEADAFLPTRVYWINALEAHTVSLPGN